MRYQHKRWAGVPAAAVAVALLAAACSSSSGSESNSPASGSPSASGASTTQLNTIVEQATQGLVTATGQDSILPGDIKPVTSFSGPAPAALPKGKTIKLAVISCAPTGGCLNTANTMAAIAGKLGWQSSVASSNGTPSTAQQLFSNALTQNVDAIVSVAVPGIFVQQQLHEAKQRGVTTIEVNGSSLSGPGYDGYVDFREPLTKALLAAWIAKDSGGKAHTLWLDAQGNADLGIAAGKGMYKLCTGCSSDSESWAITDFLNPVTVQQKLSAVLQSKPDTDYVVWPTDGLPLSPAAQAISQSGGSGRVKIVSSDLDPSAQSLIKSGQVVVAAGSQGWLSLAGIDAVIRGIAGKPIPAADAWGVGVQYFDKANLPSQGTYSAYDAGIKAKVDFVTPYAKAWGVDLSTIS